MDYFCFFGIDGGEDYNIIFFGILLISSIFFFDNVILRKKSFLKIFFVFGLIFENEYESFLLFRGLENLDVTR